MPREIIDRKDLNATLRDLRRGGHTVLGIDDDESTGGFSINYRVCHKAPKRR